MKPIGAEVGLVYQTAAEVEPGHAVVAARTGRTYLVLAARRTSSRRPGPSVWALRCLVTGDAPPDAVRHPLHWWPRPRRRPR